MNSQTIYAKPQSVKNIKDCYFYHVMEIPGYGKVGEEWDLRKGVDKYLGNVDLKGKRVLEIGPASGYLTFEMESRGAEIVGIELASTNDWDVVPHHLINKDDTEEERRESMTKLRNGFWFAHEKMKSKAKIYYGSIYNLPAALGHFDVAIMGSVLLHTRDPLKIMEQCANLSDEFVITERHFPELDGLPVASLYPTAESPQWDTWWRFSPDFIVEYVKVLGFKNPKLTFHEQTHVFPGGKVEMPMFTVVAKKR